MRNSATRPGYREQLEEITLFRWNRRYPADLYFDPALLDGFSLPRRRSFLEPPTRRLPWRCIADEGGSGGCRRDREKVRGCGLPHFCWLRCWLSPAAAECPGICPGTGPAAGPGLGEAGSGGGAAAQTAEPYQVLNDNVPYFTEEELAGGWESFETYSPLDLLGRCGPAFASVGQDLMPTEERGNISQVKPSGWQTARYDTVDGEYLYNRCHLIGFQLTGENANERNLITGTRYMNVEGDAALCEYDRRLY